MVAIVSVAVLVAVGWSPSEGWASTNHSQVGWSSDYWNAYADGTATQLSRLNRYTFVVLCSNPSLT